MNSQTRKTQELDRIGNAVLTADRLREDEIEAIANAPYMLSAVKARIIAEKSGLAVEDSNAPGMVQVFRMRAIWAGGLMVLAAVGLYAIFVSREKAPVLAFEQPVTVEKKFARAAPEVRPEVVSVLPVAPPVAAPQKPKVERAVFRAKPKKPTTVLAKHSDEVKPLEFYALASVQDPTESLRDGRIIRVDLPKASLLSLGVNVPLESGNAVVKTDLLIGADGIAKAIRLVE
jgi:hypothetical protein